MQSELKLQLALGSPAVTAGHPSNRLCPLSMVPALSEHQQGLPQKARLAEGEVDPAASERSAIGTQRNGQAEWSKGSKDVELGNRLQPSGDQQRAGHASLHLVIADSQRVRSTKHTIKAQKGLGWRG